MKLLDLNRHGGIGANSHFLRLGDVKILIDCGLHPKVAGREAMPDLARIRDVDLDLIVITHCHLDHIGSLPVLLRDHPRAAVVMSPASRMLLERMLHNSVNVMERQRDEQNLAGYPLFTHEELDRVGQRFASLAFGQTKKFHGDRDDIEITLHPAGHVAGAAGVELKHKHRRIFITGDVLFEGQRTVPGARFPMGKFDTIILETTRGTTERPATKTRAAEVERLVRSINATLERGGSVLIPVFALGRQQEILTILHDARGFGKLAPCPIYSGGLGMDLCDYFDEISKKTTHLHFSRQTVKELKVKSTPRALVPGVDPRQGGIYLLSSGMLVENTPSYTMASCLAPHARNTIAFVGYCDPDTPGGALLAAKHGEKYLFAALDYEAKLNWQVERFELSGHADREELIDFALRREPRTVVLTHGDPPARKWFVEEFARAAPHIKVIDPVPLTEIEV